MILTERVMEIRWEKPKDLDLLIYNTSYTSSEELWFKETNSRGPTYVSTL